MLKINFGCIISFPDSYVNLPPCSVEIDAGISLPWLPSWRKPLLLVPLHTLDCEVGYDD